MKKVIFSLIAGSALMLAACNDSSEEVYDEILIEDVESSHPELMDFDEWID